MHHFAHDENKQEFLLSVTADNKWSTFKQEIINILLVQKNL